MESKAIGDGLRLESGRIVENPRLWIGTDCSPPFIGRLTGRGPASFAKGRVPERAW
jgi:hypothetical protein